MQEKLVAVFSNNSNGELQSRHVSGRSVQYLHSGSQIIQTEGSRVWSPYPIAQVRLQVEPLSLAI